MKKSPRKTSPAQPSPSKPVVTIRKATGADAPTLLKLIQDLAKFEKLSHQVSATPALLKKSLTGPRPLAYAVIAEINLQPVGFALYLFNFSTFVGRPGLYVEDLFVLPKHRGSGIGLALFKALAQVAVEKNCGRMEWAVLDWNTPAIEFYQRLGAQPLNEWTLFRLEPSHIKKLAAANRP